MTKRLLTTQRIVNLASDPASATAGEIYYNTSVNSLKYYDGTQWSLIGAGEGGGASVTISETPPLNPSPGDLWYESDTGKTYIYYDSVWVEIGGGGGGGLQNVSEDTSPELGGNLDASSFNITNVDNLSFDTTPDNLGGVATMVWDDGEGTLSLGLKGGNVNLQIGQENIALCYNGTGSTISKGSVVYISGAQGQRPSLALADADAEATSSKTFGIVAENIATGTEGFVCTFGVVTGINTSDFTAGQALWLSSTAGQLTNTKPTQPSHSVFVGYCLHVNASSGRIFVNPQNGYELEELHNVSISSVGDNHILSYDTTTSLWKNQALAEAIQEVDGPLSNIDADLLDGQHGSYYAPINSPTFTGNVTVPTPTNYYDAVTKGYADSLPTKATVAATPPAGLPNGSLYFNTADSTLNAYIDGTWVEVGSVPPLSGGASYTTVFDATFDGGVSNTASFDQVYDLGNSEATELLA